MVSIDIASTEYAYTKKKPPPTACHRLWVADLRYGVIEFPYSEDALSSVFYRAEVQWSASLFDSAGRIVLFRFGLYPSYHKEKVCCFPLEWAAHPG